MAQNKMYVFLRALRKWGPYIQKKTYARSVDFELRKRGDRTELSVVVSWDATKTSPSGQQQFWFTRRRVFGPNPGSKTPQKRICRFRDDIIREVLQARSVR